MAIGREGYSLLSDPEEQFSENDTDIAYFSDIESMISDMDLDPHDQDSFYLRSYEVLMQCSIRFTTTLWDRNWGCWQDQFHKNAMSRRERNICDVILNATIYYLWRNRHNKVFGRYVWPRQVICNLIIADISIALGNNKMDKDGFFNLKNLGKYSI